ncbi:hypothetical protein FACS1894101_2990 [Betaproteobacteria bacterium]|nr:hypothetical protein FACS1894101_2990 [Betaproteobacteria bacterium]
MNSPLLERSCRVAFAALVHDLGKFAERAAHTALFMDVVEQSAPDLIRGEVTRWHGSGHQL